MVVPIDRVGGSMLAPRWSTPEELELDEVPVMGRGTGNDSPIALLGCGPSFSPKLDSLSGCSAWKPGPLWDSEAAPWEFPRKLEGLQRLPRGIC